MPRSLPVTEFLNAPGVILDVRSPGEYGQARIPGAISFPLFTNEERAQVGTCYKQEGREPAVELGLAIVGPKLAHFVAEAKRLTAERQVRVHCWRGGMRSGSMGWLLETAGLEVTLLEGGYKAFRHWAREQLTRPQPILTLGGMTGTGKTDLLYALAEQGEQILDLELLANHRGSSYGMLGLPCQPSNEQFENLIAWHWAKLDPQRPVWIEAESRRIGLCRIPDEIFLPMMQAPILQVERSRPERIALLVDKYGQFDPQDLIVATERLQKRLGGDRTRQAVEAIRAGQLTRAVELVLDYYDQTYEYALQKHGVPLHRIDVSGLSRADCVDQVLKRSQALLSGPAPIISGSLG